jgi:hypothetical protein
MTGAGLFRQMPTSLPPPAFCECCHGGLARSSPLSLTTYFFTEISFAAIGDESESLNPFKLVEAGD